MTTPGPIALHGGGEHRRGTEAIERELLEQVGAASPRVVVLPVATAPRQIGMVAALARTHWTRVGATVRIAHPRIGGTDQALDAITDADVVVLTGGVPNRLVSALGASPLWDAILQRWGEGAALSGASAGAMSLFAWRLRLYPPSPLELIPGLGPLDGWVAAPHFSRFHAARWGGAVARALGDVGVVGIDEGTALIGRHGHHVVAGSGKVTLLDRGRMIEHLPGASVAIDLRDHPQPAPAEQLDAAYGVAA